MYPMKIQNRDFFGLNMKFSMCRDYTKIFSKIAPSGKGETKNENTQVTPTILFKISKLASKLEIFKIDSSDHLYIFGVFFTLPGWSDFGNFFCIVSTHTKLHVQAKKFPVLDFHRVHDVWISLPGSVNGMKH